MAATGDRSRINALPGVATVALNQTLVSTLKQHYARLGRAAGGTWWSSSDMATVTKIAWTSSG